MHSPNIQRRYLPSHAVLRSFECAARHESFTLAAEELHLTQSAISRQVKEFEQLIGIDLFRRVGRRVVLTDAGRNLAKELALDLENIRQTVMRAVSAGDYGAALRVATLPTFASRWLIPRLPEFAALHPDIEVSLYTRLQPFDLDREKFDLAIHFGTDDWPLTDMQILCSEKMMAVASPEFIKKYEATDVQQLPQLPLLHLESRATAWQEFFHQADLTDISVLSGKYFDQFSMVIAGALASLGAALVPAYLIERELRDGSLRTLSPRTITTKNNYYLVAPENKKNEHVKLFSEWMKAAVSQTII